MNPAKTISNIQYLAATAIKPLRKGDMAVALKIHEEILQHLNLMLKELQAVSVRDALSVEALNSASHLCDYFQKTHADEALKPTAGLFKKKLMFSGSGPPRYYIGSS